MFLRNDACKSHKKLQVSSLYVWCTFCWPYDFNMVLIFHSRFRHRSNHEKLVFSSVLIIRGSLFSSKQLKSAQEKPQGLSFWGLKCYYWSNIFVIWWVQKFKTRALERLLCVFKLLWSQKVREPSGPAKNIENSNLSEIRALLGGQLSKGFNPKILTRCW